MLTPSSIVTRVRKSFIEKKIIHLNEEINSHVVCNSPQQKIDEIVHRKRELIEKYKRLETPRHTKRRFSFNQTY